MPPPSSTATSVRLAHGEAAARARGAVVAARQAESPDAGCPAASENVMVAVAAEASFANHT